MMEPVLPPPQALKSGCPKKEVKRPPPPKNKNRRPPFDNSLWRPREKHRFKAKKIPEPEAKEIIEKGATACILVEGVPQDCRDDVCFPHKTGYLNRRDKVLCGQQPLCTHPKYPPTVPDVCFSVQCYRTGTDSKMNCCFKQTFEPQGRKFFCHRICKEDGTPARCPPNEYKFTYDRN